MKSSSAETLAYDTPQKQKRKKRRSKSCISPKQQKKVNTGLLTVGHTHNDVDQAYANVIDLTSAKLTLTTSYEDYIVTSCRKDWGM
jgi:hypothetical protein